MTPSARIQSAIEIWEKIWSAGIPMDTLTGDYFRVRRYIGSSDRRDVAERIYMMMRSYARVGWWLSRVGAPDNARMRALADLTLRENIAKPHVNDLYNGAAHAPEPLNDDEQKILDALAGQTLDHADMPDYVRVECPLEALGRLRVRFGSAFTEEMQALIPPATLDLRVNAVKTNREGVLKSLAKDGVTAEKTQYSPLGLRLNNKVYLMKTKAFTEGLVEIQDEGSQLIAALCGAKPGMQVLDACAGAGGKTLALASAMKNKGRIVAMDNNTKRLNKGKPRYVRAGIHNVEVRPLDDEKNRKWLRRQKETFDVVLIDAPCSSSGTWRRNPDSRWRGHGQELDAIMVQQREILERFEKCVKPGGNLVYATCSLFPEENEQQVETFLTAHPDFELVKLPQAWAEAGLETPCPVDTDMMHLSPLRHHTDGFFTAVMRRKKAA